MSTNTPRRESPPGGIDGGERARLIREYYDEHGLPPTILQLGEWSPYNREYYNHYYGTWDDVLRDAGVPGMADLVGDACRAIYESRYPWQGSVVRAPHDIAARTGLSTTYAGRLLRDLADDEVATSRLDGLAISRCGTSNTGSQTWRIAREVDGR